MDQQSVFQVTLDFFGAKPIVVEPTAGQLTSDAGLLPFRQLDEQIGLTRGFADALTDVRAAVQVDHTFLEMVRMRVYGILADYPDQNDHDRLRSDPRLHRSPAARACSPTTSPSGRLSCCRFSCSTMHWCHDCRLPRPLDFG